MAGLYEKARGEYTPTLQADDLSQADVLTYAVNQAVYTRNKDIVSIRGVIVVSAFTVGSMTGDIQIPLPKEIERQAGLDLRILQHSISNLTNTGTNDGFGFQLRQGFIEIWETEAGVFTAKCPVSSITANTFIPIELIYGLPA